MADADNNKLLQELDALSQSLYQAHTARRTASLALSRSSDSIPAVSVGHSQHANVSSSEPRPRSRRLSMSPFRSRPQMESTASDSPATKPHPPSAFSDARTDSEKKGIWSWKPLRAISHIGKHRLAILFSVEVVAIQSLPASMNGLRLSVSVRKKESKEGAVQTMPARVLQGAADFEEILFIRSHVYCSGGGSTGKQLRFEPRPFIIFPFAVDAPELDFGRNSVDLSSLVKESMEKSFEGSRIRQWDTVFKLSGKARGGELIIKLGFQIIEDGGIGIYGQDAEVAAGSGAKGLGDISSSFARRQSKSSFSIASPKAMRSTPSAASSKDGSSALELKGIEEFSLDEDPAPPPPPTKSPPEPEVKADDLELPEFEVVDKGIELGFEMEPKVALVSDEATDKTIDEEASTSNEVVKEVVHDSVHITRLTELELIAKQINALESMIVNEGGENDTNSYLDNGPQVGETQYLDAEEEIATQEFLHMLELEGEKEIARFSFQELNDPLKSDANEVPIGEAKGYLSNLGKGLGPVVHTKDGGYLAAMNPLDVQIPRRETPKLTMQISRPIIINDQTSAGGFEFFQRLAVRGSEDVGSKLLWLTSMEELMGKTAEQIAFEGIASAIVTGRNKEVATSAVAQSVATLKSLAVAMNEGRKERILTGIWNVREEPLASMEEVLAFSLQKIETMAIEALKVQAGVAEEEAPFHVSPLTETNGNWLLDSAMSLDDWLKKGSDETERAILMVLVQLRDPMRRYEAVGALMIGMVQVVRVGGGNGGCKEEGFKVASLHVGGMKLESGRKKSVWDGERQRLTAMQWLVAYGMAKGGKKSKAGEVKVGKDIIWSLSSRIMADMWLKAMRNPDVRLLEL